VSRAEDCARFGTQHFYRERSWGVHRPTKMSPYMRRRFFRECPGARCVER
jgi:hypothetical protein